MNVLILPYKTSYILLLYTNLTTLIGTPVISVFHAIIKIGNYVAALYVAVQCIKLFRQNMSKNNFLYTVPLYIQCLFFIRILFLEIKIGIWRVHLYSTSCTLIPLNKIQCNQLPSEVT